MRQVSLALRQTYGRVSVPGGVRAALRLAEHDKALSVCCSLPVCRRRFASVVSLYDDSVDEFSSDDNSVASKASLGPKIVPDVSLVAPRARKPTIHDPPQVRRPGDIVDVASITRNWWSMPAVGFNSILEIPVQRLEVLGDEEPEPIGSVVVPNSIFGVPIRKDLVYKVYWYHRRALAGYQDVMQLYKWEWPGAGKKVRTQKRTGKSRMGRRKAPGKYEGVFSHALRPKDWWKPINKKVIWRTVKVMLSVKFAQNAIIVVDSFNLQSHKTKHLVRYLRRLVGRRCRSVMLVHEGGNDVNNNFRWASAHIACVHRENVEGVSVYKLLKYHQLIITESALAKLIQEVHGYPARRGWLQRFATPDGKPAPVPKKVDGWNDAWVEKKQRIYNAEYRGREFYKEMQKWTWSPRLKGALKVPLNDPLAGFKIKDFLISPEKPVWEKLESLYADEEPLEEDEDQHEFDDVLSTMDDSSARSSARRNLISTREEITSQGLKTISIGRRHVPGVGITGIDTESSEG
eukprot:CAMPEP_0194546414 /NCGR_PEP_ID=MMETSP0253-20130528/90626_1 /TAXON_ID=2966 /ORGANISM="Noctiluca scintillans" /LENGTH=516 /DNA_ID=CAMNT_0039393505 /DNA_START=8 /DNA_END=1554 /DNA_ORIENTATION=-